MSMFISRPSDPRTVLLWGSRWWLAGTGESIAFADRTQAAEVLATHFADEPKPVRLRLIYQPDSLVSTTVACPQGDRKILAAALAAEFPKLNDGAHAWSHEPVLANGEGYSTVLHHETEPELIALATQLAQLGMAVDSAWPLATFLNALPEEWTDSGAITIVALESERALAYRHPKSGGRCVRYWHGDSTLVEVGQWLGALFAEDAEEPVLIVSTDNETGARLESYLGDELPNLEWLRLAEALGRRVVLPRYHPAQLLPREPWFTAERAVIAASIALLLAGSWAGYTLAHDWLVARNEAGLRAARVSTLRSELAHLRENAAEIAALRSLLDGGAAGPPCGAFLQRLSRTTPPDITLSSLKIKGHELELAGWVSPSAPAGVLDDWRGQLASADAPWTLAIRSGAGGTFTATGAFRL